MPLDNLESETRFQTDMTVLQPCICLCNCTDNPYIIKISCHCSNNSYRHVFIFNYLSHSNSTPSRNRRILCSWDREILFCICLILRDTEKCSFHKNFCQMGHLLVINISRSVHVGFVAKCHCDRFFSESFVFHLSISSRFCSIFSHVSPGRWTVGPLVAQFRSTLIPSQE
jgi:hypothetical protein